MSGRFGERDKEEAVQELSQGWKEKKGKRSKTTDKGRENIGHGLRYIVRVRLWLGANAFTTDNQADTLI